MKKWSSQWTQFMQLRKKPEKNPGLQRGLNPWPRDTGAMLYQLSYEAFWVRDIWHKYHLRYFKIVSNFTRLTAREITWNITRGIYAKYHYKSCYYVSILIKWWRVKLGNNFTRFVQILIISRAFAKVKLFPNFTSISYDYLLISWVTNYVSNRGFVTCLSWIVSIEKSTLSNV